MGILGGLGQMITGQNPQAQAATNAANQASGAQNQLIQQSILPLLNQENQSYQQNQQPLEAGLSANYQGLLGLGAPQLGQNYISGLQAPGAGGVNTNQLAQQAIGVLQDPNAGGADTNNLALNAIAANQNPNTGGVNPMASAQQLIGYGSQPQNTNLAQLTPQVIQQLMSGGVLGNGQGGVGGQVLAQQLQQMTQGLSPQLQQQGLGQQQQGFDQQINDVRNMLGSGNEVGSIINQLGYQNDMARAGLEANFAGQSQGLMNQGAQNSFNTAQGLTQGANQNSLAALAQSGQLDAQTLALLQSAYGTGNQQQQTTLGNYGNAFNIGAQQQLNTRNGQAQAYGLGNTQQQTTLGNMGLAYGAANQGLGNANQYVQQGQNSMNQALSGFTGLSNQYGQAAGNAANQAQQAYNSQSQQMGGLVQSGLGAYAQIAAAGA